MGTWLIFFLVCFAGIAFMFFCVLRRADALLKTMRDEHAQFRILLQALSARLDAGSGFGAENGYGANKREAPISVDEALNAYTRNERLDLGGTREPNSGPSKGGLPDLKF